MEGFSECVGAMTSVEKLREQAAKARRLAAGVLDQAARNALNAFAAEADTKADAIIAREAGWAKRADDA